MPDHERRAKIEAYKRANERLEAALLHVINRVSTEGRDDEHKHLFLVGSEAVKHARADLDRLRDARDDHEAKRDIMDVFRSDEAMRAFGVERSRSPQGEDHEDERWTMIRRRDWPKHQGSLVPRGAPVPEPDEELEVFELARVSAPKADEREPSEQNADGG
jgi:hypothetical protein